MINKTFRLFISSTFSDFLTERAMLNGEIYTRAAEFCRSRGYHFQLIDLRWGINTESALNQQTISICLDEVRRCRTLAPRPNFLILSGERYGWIPLPPQMERARFERLLAAADDAEAALLRRWYELDENALGGAWYLKSRQGEFVDDTRWDTEETAIRRALLSAGRRCGWTEQELAMLNTSATEQEILAGFLADGDGSDNVIAVLRRGYSQQDEDPTRALALQERIAQAMEADGNGRSILRLDWDSDYERHFCQQVTQLLLANMEEEMTRLEAAAQEARDTDSLHAEGIFRGRDEEMAVLKRYVDSECSVPLFLCGDSGSGKTTLLHHFAAQLEHPVFLASFGRNGQSYTITQVLEQLQNWCQQLCGKVLAPSDGLAEQVDLVLSALQKCQDGPFTIIIDGLDMFHDLNTVRESFLPNRLPANVSVIVSAADHEKVATLIPEQAEHFAITAFDETECLSLFDLLLEEKGRAIAAPGQRATICNAFSGGATPLQVTLTATLANRWHSGDIPPSLPVTAEETALVHIKNMFRSFGHEENLTLYAMALIAASPLGITEEELQVLLPRFPGVKERLDAEDRYTGGLEKLPFVVWSRLFYDLGACLVLEPAKGAFVVKFAHQVFYRAFSAAYGEHCRLAAQMLQAFYLEQPNYADPDTRLPNLRKVLTLLPLLERENQFVRSAALLEDLSFTDAYLHAAGAVETASALRRTVERDIPAACRDRLRQLLACLLEHRDTLACYPHAFLRRCAERGLCQLQGAGITVPQEAGSLGQRIFFPYSNNAQVFWQEEFNRFAVCHGCYVSLCDGESGSEFARIYLPRGKDNSNPDATVCREFCWLGADAVLCCSGNGRAEVYDISGPVPRLRYHLNRNKKSQSVAYSRAKDILLLVADNTLQGIRAMDGARLWSVNIGKGAGFSFSLCLDGEQFYFRNKFKGIDLCDVASGTLNRRVPHGAMQNIICRGNCGRWFSYETSPTTFACNSLVYDERTKKTTHFIPPILNQIDGILHAGDEVVFYYRNGLIRMDLKNLSLHTYLMADIRDITWIKSGEHLAVLTGYGLYRVELKSFTPMGINVMVTKDRRTGFYVGAKGDFLSFIAGKNQDSFDFGRLLGSLSNFWGYPIRFLADHLLNSKPLEKATLVSFAPDGTMAVAYEAADEMSVFDSQGQKTLHCDRMSLGVNDGLLRMFFSDDSRYLLLWRNRQVLVLDTLAGKTALKVDLTYAPALSAAFSGKAVVLTLCDGSTHTIPFETRKVRFNLGMKKKDKLYYGPYTVKWEGSQAQLHSYVEQERLSLSGSCKNWLKTDRLYGELSFTGGVFALNGQVLAAPGMDFRLALELERRSDDWNLETYLREKNDLSYGLYPLGTDHLLLVSPLLGSVLLIDRVKNQVTDAYRHHSPIIGHRMLPENRLELLSAQGITSTMLEICV